MYFRQKYGLDHSHQQNPKKECEIKLEEDEAEDVKDSEDSSGDEEDLEEEQPVTIKEEENVRLAESMDTCSGIVHNQFAIFVTKSDMQR